MSAHFQSLLSGEFGVLTYNKVGTKSKIEGRGRTRSIINRRAGKEKLDAVIQNTEFRELQTTEVFQFI